MLPGTATFILLPLSLLWSGWRTRHLERDLLICCRQQLISRCPSGKSCSSGPDVPKKVSRGTSHVDGAGNVSTERWLTNWQEIFFPSSSSAAASSPPSPAAVLLEVALGGSLPKNKCCNASVEGTHADAVSFAFPTTGTSTDREGPPRTSRKSLRRRTSALEASTSAKYRVPPRAPLFSCNSFTPAATRSLNCIRSDEFTNTCCCRRRTVSSATRTVLVAAAGGCVDSGSLLSFSELSAPSSAGIATTIVVDFSLVDFTTTQ
mmetsp:Transcript_14643/g.24244  ORF Transcript_14643/g.24244 Transcript_14643/m.24244 type:complete len:262 (-) Transcript_14643:1029-1814(-)